MIIFETLVKNCEADLRGGQAQNVGRRLAKINTAKIPREFRLPLANICRRAGLYSIGMAILSKLVNEERNFKTAEQASPAEFAEYAVLLLRSGAAGEALERLEKIDGNVVPEAILFRAFAHFSLWQFEEAIPRLEDYLRSSVTGYQRLVGRVNLAYAFVACGKLDLAFPLLEENIREAAQGMHSRLESNCLALRAQANLQTESYHAARADLDAAYDLLGSAPTVDRFFIVRWRLTLEALESKTLAPIEELRKLAREHRDWDALRSADLYALKIEFQEGRFKHLLFGTPFPSYRRHIVRELGRFPNQPTYVLGLKAAPRMNLLNGKINSDTGLKPGRKCHQLIDVLLRDFYRPLRIGGLFAELFPGEHYNVASSPNRVHQLLRRTRRWIEAGKIPIEINEASGFYSLKITGDFSFAIPYEREQVDCMSVQFKKLKAAFGDNTEFTVTEARECIGVSKRTMQRLITWALENDRCERVGEATYAAKYRVKSVIAFTPSLQIAA
jgi:tetratricopeptide (TPR) repeat protein